MTEFETKVLASLDTLHRTLRRVEAHLERLTGAENRVLGRTTPAGDARRTEHLHRMSDLDKPAP